VRVLNLEDGQRKALRATSAQILVPARCVPRHLDVAFRSRKAGILSYEPLARNELKGRVRLRELRRRRVLAALQESVPVSD